VGEQPRIRRGTSTDALAVAEVYLRSRDASVASIPPLVHTDDEVRRWFAEVVFAEREVWLAQTSAGAIVGVMVLDGEWLDQLYIAPSSVGQGLGSRFVKLAKRRRPDGLQLWAFESNRAAQRFYERHGFVIAERTDGYENEERVPDLRYVWRPT
jgi:GNAT superfamily N-acetyltransferase